MLMLVHFYAIAVEKEFDNYRENPMSMGWEGHFEVKYEVRYTFK